MGLIYDKVLFIQQLMSAIHHGMVVHSRFAKALEDNEEKSKKITVERSGGGV